MSYQIGHAILRKKFSKETEKRLVEISLKLGYNGEHIDEIINALIDSVVINADFKEKVEGI